MAAMGSSRRDLIRRFREGPDVLEAALAGLSDAELDHQPADGGWTPRQVAHHAADSEMTGAIRIRRLLAEEDPVIHGYDEEEFARRLHYDDRPIAASLAAVRGARESTATLIEHLSDAEWNRTGTHTESGTYSASRWLEIYAAHCHDHAAQIERAVAESRSQG